MPYSTFFNLPDTKRQRLMDAVWSEFTSVPYVEVSINRIIQKAEISRGSFYQYFSGKQDLFSYIISLIFQSVKELFTAQLTAHNNDLFAAILGMYDLILWKSSKPQYGSDHRKLQALFRLNSELDISQFHTLSECDAIGKQIQILTQKSGYWLKTQQECFALLRMLMSVCMSTLANTMRHPENGDKNRQLLELQILIIRRGLISQKQED